MSIDEMRAHLALAGWVAETLYIDRERPGDPDDWSAHDENQRVAIYKEPRGFYAAPEVFGRDAVREMPWCAVHDLAVDLMYGYVRALKRDSSL